ncbi:hypothetical protein [Rhizobium paknamense]|uniref:Uncharacterized protein n=1 Tax=Rhizobium paknamense TaxID=1206817 RepID=A0ABU0IA35_9HYPH|nr:hypothetical protein [Rhizobium paknamense]MDQ0455081.1 hypothetical protein [Rhizobium paknamense]
MMYLKAKAITLVSNARVEWAGGVSRPDSFVKSGAVHDNPQVCHNWATFR